MAWHNVTSSSKLAGVARNTIYRKMTKGTLSYRVSKDGNKEIETSELIRVFGEIKNGDAPSNVTIEQPVTDEVAVLRAELEHLKKLNEINEKRLSDKDDTIEKMQLLLIQQKPEEVKETGLNRLFGAVADRIAGKA